MSLEDQTNKENLLFKIIIVGDAGIIIKLFFICKKGVGKTCILHQYTHQEFKSDYNVTIGVEFSSKIVNLDENTQVKLQVWDTVCIYLSFNTIIFT